MKLAVPALAPTRPESKAVVALVAYRASISDGWVSEAELSRRYLAQLLRRSDGKSASRTLKALCATSSGRRPFLACTSPGRGGKANRYALAEPQDGAWSVLGEALFSKEGLLWPFLARPAIKYGSSVGLVGCLVLGLLISEGPMARRDIEAHLAGLATSKTIRERVSALCGLGLVRKGDSLQVPPDLFDRLTAFEEETGLGRFARAQDKHVSAERTAFQKQLTGGSRVRTRYAYLRSQPCVYCGELPVAGRGTVEHFPAVHWGGSDHASLLLPSCKRENCSLGARIRRTASLPAATHSTTFAVCDEPLDDRWVLGLVLLEHLHITLLIDSRQVEEARSRTHRLWSFLGDQRTSQTYWVNGITGELSRIEHLDSYELLDELLAEHRSTIVALRGCASGGFVPKDSG